MKGNTTYSFLLGVALTAGVSSGLYWAMKPSTANQTSKPEIVFEAPPIMSCEDATSAAIAALRCTDKERDVTCYIVRPSSTSPSASCLPNQWLNYPQSIANVNDPVQ